MAVKKIKFPKKPKATASLESLKAYEKKCSDIKKKNTKRVSDETARKKLYAKISSSKN